MPFEIANCNTNLNISEDRKQTLIVTYTNDLNYVLLLMIMIMIVHSAFDVVIIIIPLHKIGNYNQKITNFPTVKYTVK